MPELPEVENFRRYFEHAALHKTAEDVRVTDERILHELSPTALRKAVDRRRFEQTQRHGKHLFVRLDSGNWLTFHFGMTGSFRTFEAGEETPRFTRVDFGLKDGGHLAYVDQRLFGEVGITEDVESFLEAHELGPDTLEISGAEFARTVLAGKRGLKSALMDQSRIAGIGNEYSDEILFQARLHPETNTAALSEADVSRLYRKMREVLKTAIERGAGMDGFEENMPAGFLLSQRQKGGSCPVCGGPLETRKVAGRTAWFCPNCQPMPGS